MSRVPVGRRQLLRFLGAGALLGSVGTASGSTAGEYIVGTRSQAAVRAARSEADSVRRTLDFGPFGGAVAGRFNQQALRGLSRRPDVSYVEPDGRMYAIAIDSGDGEVPWGVDRVDAEVSHTAGHTGAGVKVAVVDTGIDYDHPDLAANVAGGISYTVGGRGRWSTGESTDPADWDDGNGHGTHCAGTIGAVDDDNGVVGVAPRAELYGVKVLTDSGSGSWADVAAGIEWAADNGMDVASMSLGGGYSDTVENACAYAASKGVVLVAAAGNDGDGSGTDGTADTHYPGGSTYTIAVGATDSADEMAYFSSTGDAVDLVAPGVAVPSTWKSGGYNTISGTSMACPHVSGAAALLREAGILPGDVRTHLTSSAESIGHTEFERGAGLLDVPAALDGTSVEEPVDDPTPEPPASVSVDGTTETSVSLSWIASTSSDVTGYRVYRDGSLVVETAETASTDAGLSAGTEYSYGVSAVDVDGYESAKTETAATTQTASGGGSTAPTGAASGIETSPRGPHAVFTVTWSAGDDDGDLAAVDLTLWDETTGSAEESTTVDVSGGSANGTVEMKAHKDASTANTYSVRMTVTDATGTSTAVVGTVTRA